MIFFIPSLVSKWREKSAHDGSGVKSLCDSRFGKLGEKNVERKKEKKKERRIKKER